ncbi:MAG: hypothetical protein HXX11_00840 [Desulfuromonadales bacterium]|nr:hypothetical protein [Desulfuromonadales bacterium]
MAEAVTFWLDNKISSGIKMAEIGAQVLVSYRDKFYVVEGGAARMKGSRPLYYSKSSLPTVWKKALRGILPPLSAISPPEDDNLPQMTTTKKERMKMEKPAPTAASKEDMSPVDDQARLTPPNQPVPQKTTQRPPKTVKKSETKPDTQTTVIATCPHCSHHNELPLEKGKNGKPFFMACAKCNRDIAVRFVPVTVYQAQVAAFK